MPPLDVIHEPRDDRARRAATASKRTESIPRSGDEHGTSWESHGDGHVAVKCPERPRSPCAANSTYEAGRDRIADASRLRALPKGDRRPLAGCGTRGPQQRRKALTILGQVDGIRRGAEDGKRLLERGKASFSGSWPRNARQRIRRRLCAHAHAANIFDVSGEVKTVAVS